jgi:hypothetical protein
MYVSHQEHQALAQQLGVTKQSVAQLSQNINGFAAKMRGDMGQHTQQVQQQLAQLATISEALKMQTMRTSGLSDAITWQRNGVVRVEDIPGRRVPYDVVVDIPIVNGSVSQVEESWVVPQEGPFVAMSRYATFQSQLSYQVMLGANVVGRFNGRTFGRYRPIHSAWDLFDAQQMPINTANPAATGATPGVMAVTSSASGGRSMSFDGRILMLNGGSSYPRMNLPLPTSVWTSQINTPQELGALDFFERGEVITFKVSPNHVNNPPFGNADGPDIFAAGGALGAAGYPFVAGQFDPHEGIVTPQGYTVVDSVVTRLATDGITRLPDGILTVGLLGYRIIQPVGPVQ